MRLPTTLGLVSALALLVGGASAVADDHDRDDFHSENKTPIKHLVVIFQENISYDHYFGTYPSALNLPGETPFKAKWHTPLNNNLVTPFDVNHGFQILSEPNLLTDNPNAPVAPNISRQNGTDAANPFRLSPKQASTADQGHNDMTEQAAYNNGNMDGFPAWTGWA